MKTPLKIYAKSELARLYEVSLCTLLKWIVSAKVFTEEELVEYKKAKCIKSPMVQKIFESKLGRPEVE